MYHKIHPFQVYNSLRIFTRWCNYYHCLVLEQLHPPAQIPHGFLQLIISHPHPRAITDLLSISINLPFLDVSYQCNHVMCGLYFWLLSLNIMFLKFIHDVVYVRRCFFHCSIPLTVPPFIYPFTCKHFMDPAYFLCTILRLCANILEEVSCLQILEGQVVGCPLICHSLRFCPTKVPRAVPNSQIIHLFSKYMLRPHSMPCSDTRDMFLHSGNFCSKSRDKALFTPCTAPLLVGERSGHILLGQMFSHWQLSLFPPLNFSFLKYSMLLCGAPISPCISSTFCLMSLLSLECEQLGDRMVSLYMP